MASTPDDGAPCSVAMASSETDPNRASTSGRAVTMRTMPPMDPEP